MAVLCKIKMGTSDSGVVRDELIVEVGEVKKGTHLLDFGGGWPCSNAVKFDWVHGELTRFHNHSEIFNF